MLTCIATVVDSIQPIPEQEIWKWKNLRCMASCVDVRMLHFVTSCGLGTGAGWGEEPDGEIVMLENAGLESVTRQKRTRVLLLE